MEKLDNISYDLLNYSKYKNNLVKMLSDSKLLEFGIDIFSIGKTHYGYDIDCVTIGNGDKHLFIVGGTHGSEIVSVDFTLQLLNSIKYFNNFSSNEFKLFIIPLQNPEGFNITTDIINYSCKDDFSGKSLEYYYRYKIDNITYFFNEDFNDFISKNDFVDADSFLNCFKKFLLSNQWITLLRSNKRLIANIDVFINKINNIWNINNDYHVLKEKLVRICDDIIYMFRDDFSSNHLVMFISNFRDYVSNNELWEYIDNSSFIRLHQDMFKNVSLDNINDVNLRNSVVDMFNKYSHPYGSCVVYDATGNGINLNANNKTNPGIDSIRNNKIVMGTQAKGNIRNYVPGPKGVPALNVDKFEYAPENVFLYNLIKKSYDSGNYFGTMLYHGTGGMIFYKPYQDLMNDKLYNIFESYNSELASIYSSATGYSLIENSDKTGYGDLLRRCFPGVLLIELSKMGGNPIAPYGDKDNIYRTFNDNYRALDNIMGYLRQKYVKDGSNKFYR